MDVQSQAIIYLIAVTGIGFAECLAMLSHGIVQTMTIKFSLSIRHGITKRILYLTLSKRKQYRKIPFDDETLTLLKIHKQEHWVENKDDRLFSKTLQQCCQYNIKKDSWQKRPGSLPQTYISSFLISKPIKLLSISKTLGHENMNITIKVYDHKLKELEEASNQEAREMQIQGKISQNLSKINSVYAPCRNRTCNYSLGGSCYIH